MNSATERHPGHANGLKGHRRSRRAELARGIGAKTPFYRRPIFLFLTVIAVISVLLVLAS